MITHKFSVVCITGRGLVQDRNRPFFTTIVHVVCRWGSDMYLETIVVQCWIYNPTLLIAYFQRLE